MAAQRPYQSTCYEGRIPKTGSEATRGKAFQAEDTAKAEHRGMKQLRCAGAALYFGA